MGEPEIKVQKDFRIGLLEKTDFEFNTKVHLPPEFDQYKPKTPPKVWSNFFMKEKVNPSFLDQETPVKEKKVEKKRITIALHSFVDKITLDINSSLCIYPRGFENPDNKCFLNVVLQTLFSCSPFYHVMDQLSSSDVDPDEEGDPYPILSKFLCLYNQLNTFIKTDEPFREFIPFLPEDFHQTLLEFNPISTTIQEDAQEYMHFLLDRLHTEFVKAQHLCGSKRVKNNGQQLIGDDWHEVMCNGKSAVQITTKDTIEESIITDLFGGIMQSMVVKRGQVASTTMQPFFCVPLEIYDKKVQSLEDAFNLLTIKEKIEGFKNASGTEIPVSKQLLLDKLPYILLLYLKRFAYDFQDGVGRTYKVKKFISYPNEFQIQNQWLKPNIQQSRHYKLFGVINHIGNEASGGHYTCDLYHVGYNQWLRYDDAKVSQINKNQVLQSNDAYLLLYKKVYK